VRRAPRRASLDGFAHRGTHLLIHPEQQRSGEFSTGTSGEISTGIDNRQAQQRADLAEAALRQAEADRQALIDKAASGGQINQTDLARLGTIVRDARDALDYTILVLAGARSLEEKGHVAVLAAEAGHVQARYDAAVAARIDSAAVVDIKAAEHRRAVETFNNATFQLSLAATAIRSHNQAVTSAAATNQTLAAIEPGARPTARHPAHIPTDPIVIPPLILIAHRTPDAQPASVAAFVRSQHGIPEPIGSRT
jgi:hypothetical protein